MSSLSKVLVLVLLVSATSAFAAEPALRICANSKNLPWSNRRGQGFENHLAAMMARDLRMKLSYFWSPRGKAFFTRTLGTGVCDVVMGTPVGMPGVITTHAYYTSSYAFLSLRSRHLDIASFDDPRLRTLRVGVQTPGDDDGSLPPVNALVSRGIVHNLVGFSLFGDPGHKDPSARPVEAVIDRKVDIAVVWGPMAGYLARDSPVPLRVTPVLSDVRNPSLPMSFAIGIGLRPNEQVLRRRLNAELARRRPAIQRLLVAYGIPQVSLPPPVREGN